MNNNDSEWGNVVLFFLGAIGLLWVINRARENAEQIGEWLREHHLLVSASDSIVVLADTDAGLDLSRIVLITGTIALILIVLIHHNRRRATRSR